MSVEVIKEYDVHLDSKNRFTMRGSQVKFYAVKIFSDAHVLLEPRVLVHPKAISKRTLKMMDQSVKNFKKGEISKAIDLKKYLGQVKS